MLISKLLVIWHNLTLGRRTIGVRLSVTWYATNGQSSREGKAERIITLSLPVVTRVRKSPVLSMPYVEGITMAE